MLCMWGLLIVLMFCHMIQVQEAVHGVTIEECQAALQNHNWNVQKAVHYLKASHLHARTHTRTPARTHARKSILDLDFNRCSSLILADVLLSLLLYFTLLLYYCSILVELQVAFYFLPSAATEFTP